MYLQYMAKIQVFENSIQCWSRLLLQIGVDGWKQKRAL